jgi:hypothetical protein
LIHQFNASSRPRDFITLEEALHDWQDFHQPFLHQGLVRGAWVLAKGSLQHEIFAKVSATLLECMLAIAPLK